MTQPARHEEHHVDMRALRRIGLWLAVGFMAVLVAMHALWRQFPKPASVHTTAFSGARLQAHAPHDREETLAVQRRRLAQYRWTDAGHRYAQIPIERAMDIVVDDARRHAKETRP
ncbi:hypothetical protein [Dyella jiangningensis]|uniref:Uncharacterized protein n=1 Tax=Dyella jiangningensis TaxID=1379159 RepID=A0A328P2G3_9GAMM|nr:hypothetical protein [Dyella jiangningensis]RAO76179.1 hypothetical protein CA260_10800 [Dyella jiangningensis]